jgi:tetratricopeptide (TPR) repeat protein
MTKKSSQKSGHLISTDQIDLLFTRATHAMQAKDWAGAITICNRLLRYLAKKSPDRAAALYYMGTAFSMTQEFENAYQALSEAISITPENALLWFNRGIADRYLFLTGLSVRDLEKALSLNKDETLSENFVKEFQFSQKIAQSEMADRGDSFTLEELIVQQENFHQGNKLMYQKKWTEAELAFRNVIKMGDCLASPNGNLGVCLMMQRRFDEAEAAFKHALELDKDYEMANQNLAILEKVKNGMPMPDFRISEPFKGKVKSSVTYLEG